MSEHETWDDADALKQSAVTTTAVSTRLGIGRGKPRPETNNDGKIS